MPKPDRTRQTPGSTRTRDRPTNGETAALPVDVADRGDRFLVSADLPGFRTQDIDVTVRKDRLRIVADPAEETDGTYRRRERGSGTRRRVIRLPEPVDEKHVSASYTDGILWITLKKRAQPKRVEIQ
ncbi:Hsp20/alpha crystallin family protein [Halobellus sp. Atlit-31R]|nr:Hsp20/alpha crystallin family protein [Halobellus sp. Atlit-31R]